MRWAVRSRVWRGRQRHADLGARDRYLGWSAEARRRNLRFHSPITRAT